MRFEYQGVYQTEKNNLNTQLVRHQYPSGEAHLRVFTHIVHKYQQCLLKKKKRKSAFSFLRAFSEAGSCILCNKQKI